MNGKTKLYIAGPMTGYKRYNFDAFYRAEEILVRYAGYEAYNPARVDMEDHGFDPDTSDAPTPEELKLIMKRDCEALLECDGIYMLEGWEKSLGARAEHALALSVGMKIHYEH